MSLYSSPTFSPFDTFLPNTYLFKIRNSKISPYVKLETPYYSCLIYSRLILSSVVPTTYISISITVSIQLILYKYYLSTSLHIHNLCLFLNFDSTKLSSLLIIGLTQSDSENTKGNSSNMALAGQDLPLS